jgi:hypothetical protein
MKPIIFPLNPPMQDSSVADLHAALALPGSMIANAEKTARR